MKIPEGEISKFILPTSKPEMFNRPSPRKYCSSRPTLRSRFKSVSVSPETGSSTPESVPSETGSSTPELFSPATGSSTPEIVNNPRLAKSILGILKNPSTLGRGDRLAFKPSNPTAPHSSTRALIPKPGSTVSWAIVTSSVII